MKAKSRDQAAAEAGVSPRKMSGVMKLADERPDLMAKVASGEMKMRAAMEEAFPTAREGA
jgi:hypothetical protein